MSAHATSLDVTERRRAFITRIASLLGAGICISLAFWSAGMPPTSWFKHVSTWFEHKQTTPAHVIAAKPKQPDIHGPVGIAPPTPKGNDSSISKTPLSLILTGTMPGRNSREGLAMLGVDKDSPQTYAAGALLANGARIAEIYPQYIVLEKNGRSVELYLQGVKGKANSKNLNELLTVGGTQPSAPAVATHHEVLTDYIRPNPVYDGEVLKGYEVYAGQRPGVFTQMRLLAGDVITDINGVPLIDAASAMEQFKLLSEGNAVTAAVKRKGKELTLSLDGSLITTDIERMKNPPAMPGMPPNVH